MKKPIKKYLPVLLTMAALATIGATSASAQAVSSSYGTGNVTPFVYAPSTNEGGYGAFAKAPAVKSKSKAAKSKSKSVVQPWELR